MKIGYPGTNLTLDCTSAKTFRLASYSEARLVETLEQNLICLQDILRFNVERGLLFFRINSDLVPFASHPICQFDWPNTFRETFAAVGQFIRAHDMRISMHPGQFTLINSPKEDVFERAVADLLYHVTVFDLLGLDTTHKIQIHVGGIYGDKAASIERFVARYAQLSEAVKTRLVIENDERSYSVEDCLAIHQQIGIPIIFDNLHHELLNHGEDLYTAFSGTYITWSARDGLPMTDYSSQDPERRAGGHTQTLDPNAFIAYLDTLKALNFDVMLEIKDKETSAMKALPLIESIRQRVPHSQRP